MQYKVLRMTFITSEDSDIAFALAPTMDVSVRVVEVGLSIMGVAALRAASREMSDRSTYPGGRYGRV